MWLRGGLKICPATLSGIGDQLADPPIAVWPPRLPHPPAEVENGSELALDATLEAADGRGRRKIRMQPGFNSHGRAEPSTLGLRTAGGC